MILKKCVEGQKRYTERVFEGQMRDTKELFGRSTA